MPPIPPMSGIARGTAAIIEVMASQWSPLNVVLPLDRLALTYHVNGLFWRKYLHT